MLRSVRMSMVAIAVVVVLLTMQSGVEAKKKISKRSHKTTQGVPMVLVRPTFTPDTSDTPVRPIATNDGLVMSSDDVVNNAGSARTASSTPTNRGGIRVDSVGDSSGSDKKRKGQITIDPNVPLAGSLIISEFRVSGPSGANDEYVEIYNDSGANHTVSAVSGTGYAIAASDGVVRCTIPNATVIPARGHFLCVNSVAFSLGTYPAGSGTIGTGDATYATDIPDNAGIALFNNNSGGGSFSLANRFDAVGSASEANVLYKEGTGYPTLTLFSINYAFVRDECGKGAAITVLGLCTISTPKDTDNNATDFYFVDTNGTFAGAGQRLGAPGPQGLASPIQRNSTIGTALLDATVSKSGSPNRVRDFTSVPAQNSTFGTLSLRRRFVNNTGANVTRLRFRVIDLTTFPAPGGFADLRPRTSSSVVVAGINDSVTCTAAGQATPCSVTVQGTTLETAPAQPNGGGFNSSLSAGTVTLGTPLANGASIDVQFLLGLQQTGTFKIYVNIEALP
ncbi:MAG: lamin tail domain-containing protein [bacterium]